MEDDFKPAVQHQRRVNPKIHEVIKKEVIKLLDAGLIYPISDSPWVSLVYYVPKKGGMFVVENEDNKLIPTRLVTGWRVCIDYRKLNDATRKDHFSLPFMDQMLERFAGNEYYCFLDGFSRHFQIPIDPKYQDKTTFTCPYRTFAYRCMSFGLCNSLGNVQSTELLQPTSTAPVRDILVTVQKMYELLQMMQSFCEKLLQQKQAASIDQSLLKEMSIQEIEDPKQHYLDEMLSLSNDLQIKDYQNEKIDIGFRRECESMIDELKGKFNGMSIKINKKKELQHLEQVANLSTYHSQHFKSFCYDDDDDYDCKESIIPLNEIISQIPPSIVITPVLPTLEPEDSLIMGDEYLSTIPQKESDKFIKSSIEDLVPIPSKSEDTSGSDSDLPSSGDFSPINIYEEKSMTFFNPLFDLNDDFTSSDDEPLSDEDVPKDKNIKSKDSYVSNFDEPALLVTPLFDFNEDECFDPGGDVDEIKFLLYRDPSTPKLSVASILEGFTDEPPLEENDDLFDLEFQENEWKKILYDALIDDLMTEDKVFNLGIHEKTFSPTYVRFPFEDHHYLSFTYVIRIFLPYFTYPVESCYLPISSGSEDIIFDPGISAYNFYSLEPVFAILSLDHFVEIPSGESKVHIEVLSVLWGNRLPIPDGSLPLSR
ncbi:hypothetical protein Tco_1475360 [Tanacetum coccineum]